MKPKTSSPEAPERGLVFESPVVRVVELSGAARICETSPVEAQSQQTQVYFRGGWEIPGSETF